MELVRVTAIDWAGEKVLDEHCLTQYPILDLNSRYSGILSLEGVKMTLDKIRDKLQGMMGPETILAGHG